MGALSLSSPKQSPAFKASPHHYPHPPQCPEGQESAGEWARGQGGWAGGDPPSRGRPGRWALVGRGPSSQGVGMRGAVCGWSWNAGSARPAKGKGCSQRPLLCSTCPAWARGCPPLLLLPRAHICRDTQAHTHLCSPTHRPHTHAGADVPRHSRPSRSLDPPSSRHPRAYAPARLPPAPPHPSPLGTPPPAAGGSVPPPPCPRCPLLLQHRL